MHCRHCGTDCTVDTVGTAGTVGTACTACTVCTAGTAGAVGTDCTAGTAGTARTLGTAHLDCPVGTAGTLGTAGTISTASTIDTLGTVGTVGTVAKQWFRMVPIVKQSQAPANSKPPKQTKKKPSRACASACNHQHSTHTSAATKARTTRAHHAYTTCTRSRALATHCRRGNVHASYSHLSTTYAKQDIVLLAKGISHSPFPSVPKGEEMVISKV